MAIWPLEGMSRMERLRYWVRSLRFPAWYTGLDEGHDWTGGEKAMPEGQPAPFVGVERIY
jgi:hypothetical protein